MIRVEDADRIKHYAEELAKLKRSLIRITDETSTQLRCFFFAEQDQVETDPSILISVHDREFNQIMKLARDCLRRDIQEVTLLLRGMGVDPD